MICEKNYEKIIFAGMGSSNYCSVAADQYLVQHGRNSVRYSASELLHEYFNVINEETLVVITSQSGESGEIVRLLDRLPDHICTVGITNDAGSTLAERCTYRLFMNVESEDSVTTRTYMAGIAITLFLAMSITGVSYGQFLKGLLKCMKNMEIFLENSAGRREETMEGFGENGAVWLLARGCDYGTALAGSLFLREVARVMSAAENCGEFRHGPFEVVDEKFTAIMITTGRETYELDKKLAENIRGKGGRVLMISDVQTPGADIVLPPCGQWHSQFLGILPIQLLADRTAAKKGIRAGEFRWGSKITKGE